MTANKCDRCGTLYERECTPDVRINIYNHPYGDKWVDLCPKCQEKLEQFVANCWQEKAITKLLKRGEALLNDQKKTKARFIMGTTICECYNCKHLLAEGMNYCPVCGYEISEAPWKMDEKAVTKEQE